MVFNFGDGTIETIRFNSSITHTYTKSGTYPVVLTVIDTAGLSSSTGTTVTLN